MQHVKYLQDAPRSAYTYQEFPKWKYHPQLAAVIVNNKIEEKALGSEWYDTPTEAVKVVERLAQALKQLEARLDKELEAKT
jgi:hypothetical protein